jgi:hypothetical protein
MYTKINETMIIMAWAHIRKIDQTIPDDVLDFMKDCAIQKIRELNETEHVERQFMEAVSTVNDFLK